MVQGDTTNNLLKQNYCGGYAVEHEPLHYTLS